MLVSSGCGAHLHCQAVTGVLQMHLGVDPVSKALLVGLCRSPGDATACLAQVETRVGALPCMAPWLPSACVDVCWGHPHRQVVTGVLHMPSGVESASKALLGCGCHSKKTSRGSWGVVLRFVPCPPPRSLQNAA